MAEEKIGEVVKFFAKPSVAAIKITSGELNVGDTVKFSGHTTDFEETINSMEINNEQIEKAVEGDYIGVKVGDRVRPGDEVLVVTPDE
jgi:translation elongation factor EF-1alpha